MVEMVYIYIYIHLYYYYGYPMGGDYYRYW